MKTSLKRRMPVLAALAAAMLILTMTPGVAMGAPTGAGAPAPAADQALPALTPIEQLGKYLFFDKNLSANGNQSCATCHDPAVGYAGGSSFDASNINAHGAVYEGSVAGLFGNRKPPSAAYAGDSGLLVNNGGWVGGMFWDGRADGSVLGDPLAEQAKGPFLNPLEMALPSEEALVGLVAASSYAGLFRQVWGATSLDYGNADAAYDQIGISIAAYERSWEVNPYNSKFDKFWDAAVKKGKNVASINVGNWSQYRRLGLTDTELYGLAVFNDPTQADCASCHTLQPGSKGYPLFTDYAYDNIGVPKNLENPFYEMDAEFNPDGAAWVDLGLGGYLNDASENGKMKVPTLRNVDKRPMSTFVKAYGHNGYFKSLSSVVQFYHWQAMQGSGGMGGGGMGGGGMGGGGMGGGGGMMFPPPEVSANLAILNPFRGMDQSYIVAFLKTLSDGYFQR